MKTIKNIIFTLLARGFDILISLLCGILIVRFMGIEDRGIYALVMVLPALLVTFLNIGLNNSIIVNVSEKKYNTSDMFASNILISASVGLVSLIIGSLIILFLSNTLFPNIDNTLLYLSLLIIPVSLLFEFCSQMLVGMNRFVIYNVISIIRNVINIGLLILVIVGLRLDIYWIIISSIITLVISCVVLLYKLNDLIHIGKFNFNYIKNSVVYGLKLHLSSVLYFLHYRVDVLILGMLLSPISVGIYVIAVNVAEFTLLISRSVNTVLLPIMVEKDSNNTTAVATRNVILISVIILIVLFIFGELIIRLLYGDSAIDAVVPLQLLLPGMLAITANGVITTALIAKRKALLLNIATGIAVLANILLNIVLIPIIGVNGASLASTISYLLTFVVTLIMYLVISKDKLSNIIIPRISDYTGIIKLIHKKLDVIIKNSGLDGKMLETTQKQQQRQF